MINRTYSILLKGVQPSSVYYSRRCSSDAYMADPLWKWLGDMLVPVSGGPGYSQYCSEQLVQLIRKSLLKDSLAAYDPVSTYHYEFPITVSSTSKAGLPAGLYCDLLEPSDMKAWAELDTRFTVNTGTDTITVDGASQALGWDNVAKQSNIIPATTGLSIRLRGTIVSCTFNLHLIRPPARDLLPLISTLRTSSIPWHADYIQYRDSTDPDTWLAAAVLSYCRKMGG